MPNAVLLNAHSLSVAEFASKGHLRYALQAILVTQEETVATNGHYLVRVENPKAKLEQFPVVPGTVPTVEADSFLLARDAALAVAKNIPKKTTIPILNHARVGVDAEGKIQAVTTDLDTSHPVTIRATEGKFPQWKVLWPKSEPKVTICLSTEYLAQLAKAAGKLSKNLEISIWDKQSAIRLDAYSSDTEQHWSAVLMPMRSGDIPNRPFPWQEAAPLVDPFADVPEPAPVAAQDSTVELASQL
jgi:DNA polymerase III sliding clamp (beta) subunit (PCNA family)